MDLNAIPQIGIPVAESLRDMGMASLIPRMGFEEISTDTMQSLESVVTLEIVPWSFVIVSTRSRPFAILPKMEPGTYEVDVADFLQGAEKDLPITIRQGRACLGWEPREIHSVDRGVYELSHAQILRPEP